MERPLSESGKHEHSKLTAAGTWLFMTLAISGNAGCYQRHEARVIAKSEPGLPPYKLAHEQKFPPPSTADAQIPGLPSPENIEQLQAASPLGRPRFKTDLGLKVAVFGDQGMRATSRAVLQLIKREHADLVIHLGDLSYEEGTPTDWESQVDRVLGPDFPYFATIGNHDVQSWFAPQGFAQRFAARLSRMQGAHCEGEYAINASCTYRGLHFVLSGVGTYGRGHEQFLRSALETSNAEHNLCAWHKNQHDMQVGSKIDEVGWQAYQICAEFGAPVVTGHEHSYARSYALSAVGDRKQRHGAGGSASDLVLAPGRTFVVVSGLGGESARNFTTDHKDDSWWASIYAGTYQVMNGEVISRDAAIDFGVLFITYGADGDPARASAYFKTVGDKVTDQFSWQTERDR